MLAAAGRSRFAPGTPDWEERKDRAEGFRVGDTFDAPNGAEGATTRLSDEGRKFYTRRKHWMSLTNEVRLVTNLTNASTEYQGHDDRACAEQCEDGLVYRP